jgi:tRNA-dihydrouridine synthase A
MITTGALIYGDRDRWLSLHQEEHPVALQLGGSNPSEMAKCAELAQEYKFDEVNINVGCPSDRVQAGKFGACLMLEPEIVSKCIKAMQASSDLEITVKTRIGVDNQDTYEFLQNFVEVIVEAGCKKIIVHARKAHLSGLSPRQNRTVPPLHYEYIYRLKEDYPELTLILNGGLKNKAEIVSHLEKLDGVMVGREVYDNPYFLSDVDEMIFNHSKDTLTRNEVLEQYKIYMQAELSKGVPLKILAQHIFGLFNGLPGARAWRRYLSEHIYADGAGLDVIGEAVKHVSEFGEVAIAS